MHKVASTDDKKLQATLKKLQVNPIPAIEEVNLFKEDGNVIHFVTPKVQASIPSNTYVISGRSETKSLQQLLPGIISQLGPDNLANLKRIAESMGVGAMGAPDAAQAGGDDDEMPELVENFEAVSTSQRYQICPQTSN